PKDAARLCSEAAAAFLTQTMANANATDFRQTLLHLPPLAEGLAAVAAPLEANEAAHGLAEAGALRTQAMAQSTGPVELPPMAKGLAAVAVRLEPKDAARVCSEAAAILTQALAKARHPLELRMWAEGLAAMAARLEPKEAAQVATTLTQAL